MSDRVTGAPKDVQDAKSTKRWLAGLFAVAAIASALLLDSNYLVTVFVGATCALLDLPVVSWIRAWRGKNGNDAE